MTQLNDIKGYYILYIKDSIFKFNYKTILLSLHTIACRFKFLIENKI